MATITQQNQILADLVEAAREATGYADIGPETRLVHDLRLIGDDMEEFLDGVIRRYGTDFSEFVWHRHYPDEYSAPYFIIGHALRRLFRLKPVEYDPITLSQLTEAVVRGRWDYEQPVAERERAAPNSWLHTVTYTLVPLPLLLSGLAAAIYDFGSLDDLSLDALFSLILIAAVVCLSPVVGLSLGIHLYFADPPHRAPTSFLIVVHAFFLCIVLTVAALAAAGY